MIKRRFIMVFSVFTLVFAAVAGSSVLAEADITPIKINRIKDNCLENQAALNRLHQTDAFLRSDRGDLYRTISDKLMVPLNKRLAANQLDGGKLVAITASFDKQYKEFYDTYIEYDTALSDLQAINCVKEPVSFYAALTDAREKREEVDMISKKLSGLVVEYQTQFRKFKTDYVQGSNG